MTRNRLVTLLSLWNVLGLQFFLLLIGLVHRFGLNASNGTVLDYLIAIVACTCLLTTPMTLLVAMVLNRRLEKTWVWGVNAVAAVQWGIFLIAITFGL